MRTQVLNKQIERDVLTLRAKNAMAFDLKKDCVKLSFSIFLKLVYKNRLAIITVLLILATVFVAVPNFFWLILNGIIHFENWETIAPIRGGSMLLILFLDYGFYELRTAAMEHNAKKKKAKKSNR